MINWLDSNKEFLLSFVGLLLSITAIKISVSASRKQVKLALLNERFEVQNACNSFISNIIINDSCTAEQLHLLLYKTNKAEFLFGKEITSFSKEIYENGNKIAHLKHRQKEYEEAYTWFTTAIQISNKLFAKYLICK